MRFFSAVLILATKILINSSVSSSFPIQRSMLDVGCSMFIFFILPGQKQLSARGIIPNKSLKHQALLALIATFSALRSSGGAFTPGLSTSSTASSGQPVAQTPQPTQRSRSTWGTSSAPMAMAWVGHRSMQVQNPPCSNFLSQPINPSTI